MSRAMDLQFNDTPVPTVTPDESRKRYAEAHPDRIKRSRQEWRERNRDKDNAWTREGRQRNGGGRAVSEYLGKPFCAWDGEGFTQSDGTHIYNLFSGKCGDDTTSIANDYGASTAQIFETLLEFGDRHPNAIHIIYGGSYDFNMWCSDMDRSTVAYAYNHKFARWKNYRISWRRGKSFYVCRVDENGKRVGAGVTVYDIISFFQSSFVAACDSYLGDRFIHRDMIVANKAARGSFTAADLDTVTDYNDAELDNLILLAVELRERLNKVGLRPRRWDSCGAIAAALLDREGVKTLVKNMEIPEAVQDAARYAYAGGRFELIKFGHYDGPVYEYDINSAYPSALRGVPDLTDGEWEYVKGDPGPESFAVYHVKSDSVDMDVPAPLFRRDANGTVCYPLGVTGWYWSPEVEVWREYVRRGLTRGEVIEAWVFRENPGATKPFHFIEPLYMKRRALKKAGDGAHVGIKLALNSLYGKLAQQVGAEEKDDGSWRLPPYHCLEWAGYTTSHCRATILSAVIDDLDAVIAFETDAVFTTRKLDVKVGSNLGDFDYLEFKNMTYLQSGMYFADTADGTALAKTRGVDRGELTRDHVMGNMNARYAKDRVAEAKLTRFVGAGIALMQSWSKWRHWETVTKHMSLEPTGKRIHLDCPECDPSAERPMTKGVLHYTMCPVYAHAHSQPFPVMWANPNPEMNMLEELRNGEPDYQENR